VLELDLGDGDEGVGLGFAGLILRVLGDEVENVVCEAGVDACIDSCSGVEFADDVLKEGGNTVFGCGEICAYE